MVRVSPFQLMPHVVIRHMSKFSKVIFPTDVILANPVIMIGSPLLKMTLTTTLSPITGKLTKEVYVHKLRQNLLQQMKF